MTRERIRGDAAMGASAVIDRNARRSARRSFAEA
jgi:hypothetical protein